MNYELIGASRCGTRALHVSASPRPRLGGFAKTYMEGYTFFKFHNIKQPRDLSLLNVFFDGSPTIVSFLLFLSFPVIRYVLLILVFANCWLINPFKVIQSTINSSQKESYLFENSFERGKIKEFFGWLANPKTAINILSLESFANFVPPID